MLRNRSRAMTSKQALPLEQTSFLSPTKNSCSPVSSFLNSPRFFNGFFSKTGFDAKTMSPTSTLDSHVSPNFSNPFGCDGTPSKPRAMITSETEALGLALIDSIIDENDSKSAKAVNRAALFGSKLKVQIPELNGSAPESESPGSPADFGIKTRSSKVLSPFGSCSPAKDLARQLSLKEMEESEDYTCVITHGPNPKTTHIYDDCVVESCCLDDATNRDSGFRPAVLSPTKMDFLSFCGACKPVLAEDEDIYTCRDERGFCRQECGRQEMIFEGKESDFG